MTARLIALGPRVEAASIRLVEDGAQGQRLLELRFGTPFQPFAIVLWGTRIETRLRDIIIGAESQLLGPLPGCLFESELSFDDFEGLLTPGQFDPFPRITPEAIARLGLVFHMDLSPVPVAHRLCLDIEGPYEHGVILGLMVTEPNETVRALRMVSIGEDIEVEMNRLARLLAASGNLPPKPEPKPAASKPAPSKPAPSKSAPSKPPAKPASFEPVPSKLLPFKASSKVRPKPLSPKPLPYKPLPFKQPSQPTSQPKSQPKSLPATLPPPRFKPKTRPPRPKPKSLPPSPA